MCKDIRTRGANSSLVVIKNDAASSVENAGNTNMTAENAGSTKISAENANTENAKSTEPTATVASLLTPSQ